MGGTGIDINPSHSLAIQLEKDGAQFRLRRVAILPGFDHHPEREPAKAADTLFGRGIAELPASMRRNALVSIPGKELVFRSVDIGNDSANAVRALVDMEVDELSGGKPATMVSSHQIVSYHGVRRLLIGITRVELVEHLAQSLAATGLSETSFTPNAVALFHSHLVSGDFSLKGLQMLVHIGEANTDVLFVEQGDLIAVRTLSLGVGEFSAALCSALGINKEQARETLFSRINIRPGVNKENVADERAVAAAQDVAARLFQQLSASIAHARASTRNPRLEPARILLCGSGAAIHGLREFLMGRFAKTVDLFDSLSGFDLSALNAESVASLQSFGSTLAVPLGLAKIAAEGRHVAAIRITAPGIIARKNFYGRSVWLYASVILLVVSLIVSYVLLSQSSATSEATRNQARRERADYELHSRKLRTSPAPTRAPVARRFAGLPAVSQSQLATERRLQDLWHARLPGLASLGVMHHLSNLLPAQVSVNRVALESAGITDENPDYPVVRADLFIESGLRSSRDVLNDLLRALEAKLIAETGLVRRVVSFGPDEASVSDGSGATAQLTLYLADAGELLKEPTGEGGK